MALWCAMAAGVVDGECEGGAVAAGVDPISLNREGERERERRLGH